MIIIKQTHGSSLSNLVVDEVVFQEETGLTATSVLTFESDGNDWQLTTVTPAETVDLADYGITYSGTAINGDEITVAYQPSVVDLHYFSPGNGVNAIKLNENFAALADSLNTNENDIQDIADTALLKDGSNLTQTIINEFQAQEPNILSTSGTIALDDNTANFLTLTGNGVISLPTIASDIYSHTIILVVEGGSYSLDVATATNNRHFYVDVELDPTQTYCVLFVYNKIENAWYYCLNQ